MNADGTGERSIHVVLRVQSESAAQQFSVLGFNYASATETPAITLVRVHKPNGAIVDTPASDAIDMAAAVTREAPLYSDLKQMHVPVRSLASGDILEYEVHTAIHKAEAPGKFWGTQHFTPPGSVIVLSEVLTLEVPADKYVQVWSPNHKPAVTEHDGVRSYRWEVAQLVPAPKAGEEKNSAKSKPPKDPDEDANGRQLPSVAWTTFHNWAEVGDWYRSLALERAQPNDALRARADEVTKDAKTPDEQVRAIYRFVSERTRYVGIDFGVGRYQPHAAGDVLANGYGDCKDKDTLLEALLRAKGFHTAPALIGAGITPVADVPTPAVFNHVITTVDLPGGRIWLDSTPAVAPYRYLSATIRDELALVVPANAPAALERTPAVAPYPFAARFEMDGALDSKGKLTGHVQASYRTDGEVIVRALARSVAPAEWDKVSQYFLSDTGINGTASNTSFKNSDDLSSPIVLTYDYTVEPYGDWETRRIVPTFPPLEFSSPDKDDTEPASDIQLGAPRTLIAINHIGIPEGYRTDLPDPVHVKTDFATFDQTYRFDGKEIIVERDIVVLKNKLPRDQWKRYGQFTKDIDFDGEPYIDLIPPPSLAVHAEKASPENAAKPGSATAGAGVPQSGSGSEETEVASTEGESAQEMLRAAHNQMMSHDADGAMATLDKVKAKNPNEPYLWEGYGLIAMNGGDDEGAQADFKKELAAHPDEEQVVGLLAEVENRDDDSAAARRTIRSYLEKYPGNLQLSMYLASLQSASNDYPGALKTLEAAADSNPDDRTLRLRMSDALVHLGRNDEAAAAAKSVLDGTDDPELRNDAAYVLSETNLDLSYAEDASRKSIATLEEKSAAITPAEANSSAFAQSNLLIASWDTLGWILFREGKLQDALPLVLAGWRDALGPEGGDHLGQIYEALGKEDLALGTYQLAEASIHQHNVTPDIREHIAERIAVLKGRVAKASLPDPAKALQDLRTYKIARPAGAKGWGTFRIQITTAGAVASQQMSGDEKLAKLSDSINAMKFPDLVPPGSKARLLRSAVMSCDEGNSCDLVLVPESNLSVEAK